MKSCARLPVDFPSPPTYPCFIASSAAQKKLELSMDRSATAPSLAIKNGYSLLILSDRGSTKNGADFRACLARLKLRPSPPDPRRHPNPGRFSSVESGEPREVMHLAS